MNMTANPPPQAYTRQDVIKAYEWMLSQPKETQRRARDSAQLVSLYLQSRRGQAMGSSFTDLKEESPSAEAFREDLKSLTEAFRDFEGLPPTPPSPQRVPPHLAAEVTEGVRPLNNHRAPERGTRPVPDKPRTNHLKTPEPPPARFYQMPEKTLEEEPLKEAPKDAPPSNFENFHLESEVPVAQRPQAPPHKAPVAIDTASRASDPAFFAIDSVTEKHLNEAKSRFNLSSNSEACRLLIQLGIESLRAKFPDQN